MRLCAARCNGERAQQRLLRDVRAIPLILRQREVDEAGSAAGSGRVTGSGAGGRGRGGEAAAGGVAGGPGTRDTAGGSTRAIEGLPPTHRGASGFEGLVAIAGDVPGLAAATAGGE